MVVDDLAGILGCEVASFPLKYSDLPLFAKFNDLRVWDLIIAKHGNKVLYLEEEVSAYGWETYPSKYSLTWEKGGSNVISYGTIDRSIGDIISSSTGFEQVQVRVLNR